jgi:hypothetical protein
MNGRCVYCDHGEACHPGADPKVYNTPLGVPWPPVNWPHDFTLPANGSPGVLCRKCGLYSRKCGPYSPGQQVTDPCPFPSEATIVDRLTQPKLAEPGELRAQMAAMAGFDPNCFVCAHRPSDPSATCSCRTDNFSCFVAR